MHILHIAQCTKLHSAFGVQHGLINNIDMKAKSHHLQNWSVKGLCGRGLSEFIDWRYSQSCWYFRPRFLNVAHLTFSLHGSTLPPPAHPCENKYTVHIHVYSVWGNGVWVSGPRTDKTAAKSLYRSIFFDDNILHCLLWVLSFYVVQYLERLVSSIKKN